MGRDHKERYTELLVDEVEAVIAGFRGTMTFVEGATPLALERWSLNKDGALYGWENAPDQTLTKRLSNRTPIDRLYLSSAWAQPGSGTVGAWRRRREAEAKASTLRVIAYGAQEKRQRPRSSLSDSGQER